MKIMKTRIPDVKIIEPKVFSDERGFFLESWNEKVFREVGIGETFVQDNHSRSIRNTLRGLHYQIKKPQGKLVRVTRGEVIDVVVDMRLDSATLGQWISIHLSDENMRMLWVPPGFAHGFFVVSEVVDFQYKCTEGYFPEFERTVCWNDSDLNIEWGVQGKSRVLVSEKDQKGISFARALLELKDIQKSANS